MARVDELLISEDILEKLERKHGIGGWEVEEACLYSASGTQLWRRGRGGTMRLFARTFAGRYLFVVLFPEGRGRWRVVTARGMTLDERRDYREQKGG